MKAWHVVAALGMLTFVAVVFRDRWMPPKKAKAASAVIAELNAYGEENGDFNLEPRALASVQELENSFQIYFGDRISDTTIEWMPHEVSKHDFSIFVHGTGYSIFLPTSKIKPYSISSFWVWQYSSDEGRWQRGKIYWTLTGSFWTEK